MSNRDGEKRDDVDSDVDSGVDFVVGAQGAGPEPTMDGTGPGDQPRSERWASLRLRLTLAGAAAVLALGTLIARSSSQHHDAKPSPSPTPSSSAAAAADSPQPILNPFQLATRTANAGDCPFATTCSSAPTPAKAIAAVRSVFVGSTIKSSSTRLGVYDGHFGPNLLFRRIEAHTPTGQLTISIRKPTDGDADATVRNVDPKLSIVTVVVLTGGYVVNAQLAQHSGRTDPGGLLAKLASDPRLLVVR